MNRRTKIIATIGPASDDPATLRSMIEAGMDVARINLSHARLDEALARYRRIRDAAHDVGQTVGIMVDLPGPKVRTGPFDEPAVLEAGSEILLRGEEGPSNASEFSVGYETLLQDLQVGDRLAMGDGTIVLDVVDKRSDAVVAEVVFGGVLRGRPGLHIPSDRLRLTSPTDTDLRLLDAFVDADVDMISVSYVRSAHDIRRVGLEPSPRGPLIVAKIETRAAVENLDGIIRSAGAVMVARGDLGAECSLEELPHLQKEIIARCVALGRPAITATQMLESMMTAPSPTRAEATDIANAVFDGTSAVMLAGETAIGRDPVLVVKTMAKITTQADQKFDYSGWAHSIKRDRLGDSQGADHDVTDAMTLATWRAASDLGLRSIVCVSRSGFTVRAIARFRPQAQIIGFSPEARTLRQLTMSWGATPVEIDRIDDLESTIARAMRSARDQGLLRPGELVAVLAGSTATAGVTDTLRLIRCT